MPWPQTGVIYYHAQCRAIKGLIVCYVVWLGSMTYKMGLWTSARCLVWSLVVVSMAIKLKYRNIPQIHTYIDTYHITNFFCGIMKIYTILNICDLKMRKLPKDDTNTNDFLNQGWQSAKKIDGFWIPVSLRISCVADQDPDSKDSDS